MKTKLEVHSVDVSTGNSFSGANPSIQFKVNEYDRSTGLSDIALKRAFVVGGMPAFVSDTFADKLKSHGIRIVDHFSMEHRSRPVLPQNIDLVILLTDSCSHVHSEGLATLCKKANVPFVNGYRKWAKTAPQLEKSGFPVLANKQENKIHIPSVTTIKPTSSGDTMALNPFMQIIDSLKADSDTVLAKACLWVLDNARFPYKEIPANMMQEVVQIRQLLDYNKTEDKVIMSLTKQKAIAATLKRPFTGLSGFYSVEKEPEVTPVVVQDIKPKAEEIKKMPVKKVRTPRVTKPQVNAFDHAQTSTEETTVSPETVSTQLVNVNSVPIKEEAASMNNAATQIQVPVISQGNTNAQVVIPVQTIPDGITPFAAPNAADGTRDHLSKALQHGSSLKDVLDSLMPDKANIQMKDIASVLDLLREAMHAHGISSLTIDSKGEVSYERVVKFNGKLTI